MTDLSFQYAIAQVAFPGFSLEQAGDSHVIEPFDEGVLVAGIDGLGHGPKAAAAAAAAADALRQQPSRPAQSLLEHCNLSIRGTRGAAVSVASVNTTTQQLEWAGVGNVMGVIVRDQDKKRETLFAHGGVVGFRMPHIRTLQVPIHARDMLILTTDGIRSGYMEDAPVDTSPQKLADYILDNFKRNTDDALVMVIQFTQSDHPH